MAAPENNNNAEKWTESEAIDFMEKSLDKLKESEFDFIGELAQSMGQYRTLYNYLAEKFSKCKTLLNRIEQGCEANCFRHGKKGDIVPSLAIMNLKSNHGWTDRIDTTTKDKEISSRPIINFTNGNNPKREDSGALDNE